MYANAKKSPSIANKISVVGVTHTGPGGTNSLEGEQEAEKVISIIKEPSVNSLTGEEATVDAVKLQLQDCTWAHLACHGSQDLVEPTKSYLQLYGGVLELETILRMDLPNAQFVFVATGKTAGLGSAELANQSLHLCGGLTAAGFRAAIGTMWNTNHDDSSRVAEIFYSHLFQKDEHPQASDTAEALHLAIVELKKRKVPYKHWVPFIHMGV